ncbi:MAG: hypothetical protein A2821_01390 [Candidatus Magasanikbacteria bacterium RIFCSPHIGHO2_01_FULL_41_23]|uniref:Cell shape determination protein CcmA n=1 Tax=Candidatus Magasanikbacteria bacterium RIFCSPLOWO2_01_FULL_40_15 TaxID=1798686 RepID=A0A1F6N4D9_9BACT|nr:MAG: hypothetical protein A2821_01390 [Candidatus Magasanikbacteria bacterium RIFCSPHIGHO2_01_FULL_41_23]OGH66779.1 MAG: hypothetical protein A3C66_01695 [Candidatus Magasanikbacteria bacterium RIFCSPHIGHO2_02_FULL_41_35]OGH74577.1 MAG: hypothetical protein A3F22_03100 [Candidatus Magasanikbacteria bacterium RIFCSPHIGHO2_12_FULL_41_16]OGH78866.1 MAG: hypothetical protein A2983_00850 [Candidatus Magasanikbacteria bacterium RIFCSPLOWO2_01_FULL_40_15]
MFPKSPAENKMVSHDAVSRGSDDVETVVGPSVVVEGDFASEGNILVKGTVSGSVKTARLLTVEPGAKIMANVKAGDAVVAGEVRGSIKVEQQLELTASARVLGDIQCQILVVAAGALLQGKVAMKGLEGASTEPNDRRRVARGGRVRGEEEMTEDSAEV